MMVALIVACEIAFWVVAAAGLLARYLLRWRRVSTVLLLGVPVVDVVLLAASAIDLHQGGTAEAVHGLAAAYLGFSVAFGHSMVRWADQRVAHWFAGGPPPWRPPKQGPARVAWEWREWGKALSAVAIACGLLLFAVMWIGDPDRTGALSAWMRQLGVVAGIWFLVGPLWTTIFRKPLF